jgi:AGCS family alanine or glycine:cation symporter
MKNFNVLFYTIVFSVFFSNTLNAQSHQDCPEIIVEEKTMSDKIDDGFAPVVEALASVLFWDPFEAAGIYDPVVYDGETPVNGAVKASAVYGDEGSYILNGHCTVFKDLGKGSKIIIDGNLYKIASIESNTSLTLKTPLKSSVSEAEIYATVEKPILFIVIWLVLGAIFFTIKTGFINIRGFKHSVDLVRGKFDPPMDDPSIPKAEIDRENAEEGEVSHFQALVTALSATVGLGNIAGVAIAIAVGGAGATFWLIIAGFLGMSTKFIECTLGVKYRNVNSDGEVSGGPMYYLSKGLKKQGKAGLGKVLAIVFAILCIGGSFGGGNMFQANQAYGQVLNKFSGIADVTFLGMDGGVIFGIIMATLVAIVIIGGIKSIAKVTDKIVPFMVGLYVITALIIIFMNITNIGSAFSAIFEGAFSPDAAKGGILGVLIVGFQRAAFSNEAGVGSASIAHSAVKTDEPVTEGFVSLLEPFIDTVVVCTMTALVLIFTGYDTNPDGLEGAALTTNAFASVFPWFDWILLIAIVLFAFSTMISWSYYGMKAWTYLFGEGKIKEYIYKGIFLIFIVVGAASSLGNVMDFSDLMILGMAFPNILGLVFLSGEVKQDMKDYLKRVKTGVIKKYK